MKPRRFLVAQASQAAEKLKMLSFRDMLLAEESLILFTLKPGEIPHPQERVRNDNPLSFPARCEAGPT
jgi:hypothetical protein